MAGILPGLVTGSVIVEFTFSLPGMGTLLIDSIIAKDFPTISAIFLLMGFMTILGILASDVLLAMSDPRIKMARK
jgi:ABC-type dipeptide/oligopeptide/nickel transport system permease component